MRCVLFIASTLASSLHARFPLPMCQSTAADGDVHAGDVRVRGDTPTVRRARGRANKRELELAAERRAPRGHAHVGGGCVVLGLRRH